MSKNTLTDAQNRFWFGRGQHIVDDWQEPPRIRDLSNEAFTAGARWAYRQSSALAPHIALFIEMMLLLGLLEPTTDEMVSTTSDGTGDTEAGAGTAGDQGEHGDNDLPAMPGGIRVPGTASARPDA